MRLISFPLALTGGGGKTDLEGNNGLKQGDPGQKDVSAKQFKPAVPASQLAVRCRFLRVKPEPGVFELEFLTRGFDPGG